MSASIRRVPCESPLAPRLRALPLLAALAASCIAFLVAPPASVANCNSGEKLAAMPLTEIFDGSEESLSDFESEWSTLGWAGGGTPKGSDTTSGWRPVDAFATALNGAYYKTSFSDTGEGIAAVATMASNPELAERYLSVWLDLQSPGGTREGYELRLTYTATNTYGVKLAKWVSGSETVLDSETGYSFADSDSLAIVDLGGTVSAWIDTGSGFQQLLSASDSTFSSGNAGIEGKGNITRLRKFKAGPLSEIGSPLAAMPLTEIFDGSEESLSDFESEWSTLGWAGGGTPKGSDTTSGWRPVDAFATALNGAYYKTSFSDTGEGIAAVATMASNPELAERYLSVWLDLQSPGGTREGYELRLTYTATNTYGVKLAKWVSGSETVLDSETGYSFADSDSLAIVDLGGTVSAWIDTGSGFQQLLSASDSTFSSGNAGIEGKGNITRLRKFKAGPAGVDSEPPDTTITEGPEGAIGTTSVSFSFTSTEPESTFECSLDEAAFAVCTSPKDYESLAEGPHDFRVRAIDPASNVDPTPAEREFEIVEAPSCEGLEGLTANNQSLELTLECTGEGELDYKIASEPEHGSLSELDSKAGTVTYASDPEFTGTDEFEFQASAEGVASQSATATIEVCAPPEIEASGEVVDPEVPGVGLSIAIEQGEPACQEGSEETYVSEYRIYIDEELVSVEERECESTETESCSGDFERGLQLPYAKVIGTHDYRVEAFDQLGFEADARTWSETTPEEGTISQIPPEAEDSAGSEGCKTPKNRYKHYFFRGNVVHGTKCADIMGRYPGHNTKVYKAGAGDDVIRAGGEVNKIRGGAGDDRIYAGRGNDTVYGDAGDDLIVGGSGDDTIRGNSGDDNLAGNGGSDELRGGADDDLIRGGTTADKLIGGGGENTLSFADAVTPGFEFGSEFISGFPASGTGRGVFIDLGETPIKDGSREYTRAFNGYTSRFGGGSDRLYVDEGSFQHVIGSPFADVIIGSSEANLIDGGGGPDILEGKGGDDQLYGGADSDLLDGGEGQSPGNLRGGDGDDICLNGTESAQSCERESTEEGLKPTSSSAIVLGRLNPDDPAYDTGIYLRGTEAADNVTATYKAGEGVVRLIAVGEGGTGRFDTSANEVSGCTVAEAEATCPLSAVQTLVMDGRGGNDALSAHSFPAAVAVTLLGGAGRDVLRGGGESEELLVDGPGDGKDDLYGFGDDDTFFANEGRDRLYGADGSDLFVSSWPCEDRIFGGGDSWDNASWAQVRGEEIGETGLFQNPTNGAEVSLPQEAGKSGSITRFGSGCGEEEDGTIKGVEFLEGSGGKDRLEGNGAHNVVLGRSGKDRLLGLGGDDNLLANNRNPNGDTKDEKEDPDETLNCGGGGDDSLRYDIGYDSGITDCELLKPSRPAQFSVVSGIGSEATGEASVSVADEGVIGGADDPEADPPVDFYRFDETAGSVAKNWVYEDLHEEYGAGTYHGGVALDEQGALEESRAIKLDGEDDYVSLLGFGGAGYAPGSCSKIAGYSMEMWVKFDSSPGDREALFSGEYVKGGIYVYRSQDGRLGFTLDKFSGETPTVRTDEAVSTEEWHHVAIVALYSPFCKGEPAPTTRSQMKLYVDGFAYPLYFEDGYYPLMIGFGGSDLVGARKLSSGLTEWLSGTVDDLATYERPLSEGEVLAHFAIGDASDPAALLVPPLDPEDGDADEDGVLDSVDNCPEVANESQADADGDGVGDACQEEPDSDGDEIPDEADNCPEVANEEQTDSNENGIGDACEPE